MRITVLMGGPSREREVSLRSGAGVADALTRCGHVVTRVVLEGRDLSALDESRPDIVFLALHGTFGEDGEVQRALEARGLPYTGSGPLPSWRAFEKTVAKEIFWEAHVPTPAWVRLEPPFDQRAKLADVAERIGFPLVVKPVAEGSSIGVSIVRGADDLAGALAEVEKLGGAALCEPFLPGRELTVGILDGVALPPIELVPKRTFYDYQAKYDPTAETMYVVDPPLEATLRAEILSAALAAHRALGCEGASRVDVRLDARGRPFILEVNTIPGMTAMSLLPKAAKAAGIEYGELCERICLAALARQPRVGAAA